MSFLCELPNQVGLAFLSFLLFFCQLKKTKKEMPFLKTLVSVLHVLCIYVVMAGECENEYCKHIARISVKTKVP